MRSNISMRNQIESIRLIPHQQTCVRVRRCENGSRCLQPAAARPAIHHSSRRPRIHTPNSQRFGPDQRGIAQGCVMKKIRSESKHMRRRAGMNDQETLLRELWRGRPVSIRELAQDAAAHRGPEEESEKDQTTDMVRAGPSR
jgi:hypothetical protein